MSKGEVIILNNLHVANSFQTYVLQIALTWKFPWGFIYKRGWFMGIAWEKNSYKGKIRSSSFSFREKYMCDILVRSIILNYIISAFNFGKRIVCHLLHSGKKLFSVNKSCPINPLSTPSNRIFTKHGIKYERVLFTTSIALNKTINDITIIHPHCRWSYFLNALYPVHARAFIFPI